MRVINGGVRAAVTLALIFAGPATPVHCDSLDTQVIGMFPKNIGEIAYADLTQARTLPWFAQFERQVLPSRFLEFAQFLKSAGIDPETQMDGVAWALGSGSTKMSAKDNATPTTDDMVCIAIGRFDSKTVQDFFKTHKIREIEILDYKIYATSAGGTGNLFMMFLNSGTIAFGPRGLLERLIRVQGGEEQSLLDNEALVPLVNQANGDGLFWGVINTAGARQAIRQLIPAVAQFGQASKLIDNLRAVMISVQGSGRMEADFLAVTGSPQDAIVLSQLVQAALMLRQYQVTDSNPEMAQVLAGVTIAPSGSQLKISFSLTEDQVLALVKHGSFVSKM